MVMIISLEFELQFVDIWYFHSVGSRDSVISEISMQNNTLEEKTSDRLHVSTSWFKVLLKCKVVAL